MFDVSSTKATYDTLDLLAVIFLGVVGGIFGSLYNYCIDKVLRIYSIINEYVPGSFYFLMPFMFITMLLLSTIKIFLGALFGVIYYA